MGWLKVKVSATVQLLVKFDLNHRILELLYITVLSTIQLEKMLRTVIWHLFFGDLSQSEKLSEIKPPVLQEEIFKERKY